MGTFTTKIWVDIEGKKVCAEYRTDISLEEARWLINHEVFVSGIWVCAGNVIYL